MLRKTAYLPWLQQSIVHPLWQQLSQSALQQQLPPQAAASCERNWLDVWLNAATDSIRLKERIVMARFMEYLLDRDRYVESCLLVIP